MKIRWWLVCVGLLGLLIASPPAQAHHANASKVTGTYWKCTKNGTKSKGTTRVHIHHAKPSKKHMRRHHCKKRVRKEGNQAPAAVLPQSSTPQVVHDVQVVYVPVPGPCGQCDTCKPDPCDKPKPPPPPCEKGEDTHKNEKHRCKHGKGHYKDHDQEDDD